MDNLFIPVKKTRLAIYIFILMCSLGTAILIQLNDSDPDQFWDILTYICMIMICYLIFIYGKDLLSKKAGLYIEKQGLYLNMEYYKNVLVSWKDITSIENNKYTVLLHVKDSQKYLKQLPKIYSLYIKSNIKRFGTLFVLRFGQISMKKDVLLEKLKQSLEKYKKSK
ncbi:MAG: hypothetical protein JW822_10185 [Spirochaetales bacterium]|nr:hypothetical protein [Spirochaetales bacterium]